ncbi:hypothetical protein [Pseudanabaena sp. 'Roaring Creek']|nr:hypothetical protein [Pseudanabaena sp. 'Roaring Creek']
MPRIIFTVTIEAGGDITTKAIAPPPRLRGMLVMSRLRRIRRHL